MKGEAIRAKCVFVQIFFTQKTKSAGSDNRKSDWEAHTPLCAGDDLLAITFV